MKGVIQFTVDDKDLWEAYAKSKGFKRASDLARVALYQYESRHPSKSVQVCTAGAIEGNL